MAQTSGDPTPAIRCPYCRNQFNIREGNLNKAIANLNEHITKSHPKEKHVKRNWSSHIKLSYK